MLAHAANILIGMQILCSFTWAHPGGVSSVTKEVARDLFSPTGLLLATHRFRKLFLDARFHGCGHHGKRGTL